MKNVSRIAVFLMLVVFGSSAFAGDPRDSFSGYVGAAAAGGLGGLLIGDNHESAAIGAGAMVIVNGVRHFTQSTRRVTTIGGQQYQGQQQYQGDEQYYDYYDRRYNDRRYRPQPGEYIGPRDEYQSQSQPYYDANGFHCNEQLGLCKHSSGTGYVYTMQ